MILQEMSMRYLIFTLVFFFSNTSFGQDTTKILDWNNYFREIKFADSLYSETKYLLAANAYTLAFANNNQGFSFGHKYNAAKAWAMNKNIDSVFSNLKQEIEVGFCQLDLMRNEKAFNFLHKNYAWKKLLYETKKNKLIEDKKLGKYKNVKYQLEDINNSDQEFRKYIMDVWKKSGQNSKEYKELQFKMKINDSLNLIKIEKIIAKYGWIGYDTIGYKANQTLFLVIQHSDLATQIKFLPMLRNAVLNKKAMPEELALLEDRILVTQGKNQIFGTQVNCDSTGFKCFVYPIADEKDVENRRKSLGMRTLVEYLKSYGIEYRLPSN